MGSVGADGRLWTSSNHGVCDQLITHLAHHSRQLGPRWYNESIVGRLKKSGLWQKCEMLHAILWQHGLESQLPCMQQLCCSFALCKLHMHLASGVAVTMHELSGQV